MSSVYIEYSSVPLHPTDANYIYNTSTIQLICILCYSPLNPQRRTRYVNMVSLLFSESQAGPELVSVANL